MYPDSDSDDDYDDTGYFLLRSDADGLEVRAGQRAVTRAKQSAFMELLEEGSIRPRSQSTGTVAHREQLRAYCDRPNIPVYTDWMRWRVLRFFTEFTSFHQSHPWTPDLTARSPERYAALLRQWNLFKEDMATLLPYITYQDVEREEINYARHALELMVVTVASVSDDTLWEAFRLRWKIPPSLTADDIIDWYHTTWRILETKPTPRYQSVRLTDFPPEILASCFGHCDPRSAQALAAATRYLREVGLSHAYATRCISMERPLEWFLLIERTQDLVERDALTRQLMTEKRDQCIDQVSFLLSRPDIYDRVKRLTFENAWLPGLVPGFGITVPHPTDSLFQPLFRSFDDVFSKLRALESLELIRVVANFFFLVNIVRQPALRSMTVSCCRTTEDFYAYLTVAHGSSGIPERVASTLVRLILQIEADDADETGEQTAWRFLAICPRLRLLHVYSKATLSAIAFPSISLWPSLSALNSIERLHLSGTSPNINRLIGMFVFATQLRGPLAMTHLKIQSHLPIQQRLIMELLQVLRSGRASLRVLVLDGIMTHSTELFDAISRSFPALEALTLIRRETDRQRTTRLCRWDRPIYDYAESMRPLSRLRYFAANFYWDALTLSPNVFRQLEPDYVQPTEWSNDNEDYLSDGRLVALPFAAACSALETFVLSCGYATYSCSILRQNEAFTILDHPFSVNPDGHPEYNPPTGKTFPFPSS
ncbi:hypothetical protein EXIGLDRAFT_845044 [Exidia glandulosa HHB12029]|uniref:F-box domain-containing protein n=1 Tax=Exidia glandulosa HHB12029 TaxID=1314781 RepID=A0A165BP89_EXIGL|nr:hypothetical protein EXIGLDRAFT_845044 [Exidia glandulosa HHB12029]